MAEVTISRGSRRAAIGLLALTLLVGGGNLWASWDEVHAYKTAQQRQGQAVEVKLCTTLGKLSALVPPPGPPEQNPSRAYEQALHGTLVELGSDIGCKG